AVLADHYVFRLDVAMNDAFGMGGCQRRRNLNADVDCDLELERAPVDLRSQRLALDIFRGNEMNPTVVADLIRRNYVRMVDGRRGAGFSMKPHDAIGRLCELSGEQLERHPPIHL